MKYQAKPVVVDAYPIAFVGPPRNDIRWQETEGGKTVLQPPGSRILLLVTKNAGLLDEQSRNVIATPEMLARIEPKVGDYWIEQADGYVYLNPKDVFERKYSPVDV